jgi:hypothetical protein
MSREIYTVYEDEDFIAKFEDDCGIRLAHVTLFKDISPTLVRKLRRVWSHLKQLSLSEGYLEIFSIPPKSLHFVKILDPSFSEHSALEIGGEERGVVRWVLK